MPFLHPVHSHHHHLHLHHPNGAAANGAVGTPLSGQLRRKKSFGSSSGSSRKSEDFDGPLAPLFHLIRHPTDVLASAAGAVFEIDKDIKKKRLATARLENATTYADWHKAAIELDELEGNEAWKSDPRSPDYDWRLVESRLKQLEEARLSCDVGRMLFLIRTTLTRNLGDMGNIRLYKHARTGTKHLIEEYISSCLSTLTSLLSAPSSTSSTPSNREILDSLIATRQAFGRTALLLSGGATFGMNHVGVLKALLEASLLPRIISGASAGSIVAAVLCTRTDDEIPTILKEFPFGNLDVFEDGKQPETVFQRVGRFLKIGAWIDIKHLTRVMRDLLGDMTFQEAYNRTRRILNICVSSASIYELPRLLNYVTSPNVLIWSAVAASCSVPFLFTSTVILAKDPKTGLPVPWNPSPQRWIDGSVDNDLPMTRLAEMFNVNHFIVSQVNPHVVPFLSKEDGAESQVSEGWGDTLVKLALGEALHRMNVLAELGVFRTGMTKLQSVLTQKYSGDITILPEVAVRDFPKMLKNPDPEFMFRATLRGERATWPKLSRVANHCRVELALDAAIYTLRTRVVFSPSMSELRLGLGMGRWRGQRWRSSEPRDGKNGAKDKDGRRIRKRASCGLAKDLRSLIGYGHRSAVEIVVDDTSDAEGSKLFAAEMDDLRSTSSTTATATSSSEGDDEDVKDYGDGVGKEEEDEEPDEERDEEEQEVDLRTKLRERRRTNLALPGSDIWPPDRSLFPSTSQPGTPSGWFAPGLIMTPDGGMEGRGEGGGFVF